MTDRQPGVPVGLTPEQALFEDDHARREEEAQMASEQTTDQLTPVTLLRLLMGFVGNADTWAEECAASNPEVVNHIGAWKKDRIDLDAALRERDEAEGAIARIADRALRIMDGRVKCSAYSAADYDLQILSGLSDEVKSGVASLGPFPRGGVR